MAITDHALEKYHGQCIGVDSEKQRAYLDEGVEEEQERTKHKHKETETYGS